MAAARKAEGASLRPPLLGFVDRHCGGETKPFRLWELILADNAEAEFIVAGVGKPREGVASYYLMQFIHHDVMTTCKSSINSGRLQYR